MAFDAQALWDLTSPITMPSMSDNDFLMLLEKQMQAAHPTSGNATTATADGQQGFSNINPMVAPSSVMAPPPVPADTMSPPLTDESSPSPPGTNNDNTVGDGSKRKASRDDSQDVEGQPRSKVQHKANDDSVNSQTTPTKKPPARRKSGGNANVSDEGRLAKRKEQNRAAQRAFRDRRRNMSEMYLEEKIQELEQKFNTSESENTNLKDLLKRLQNENMMLKQSAFTFEFAPSEKSSNQMATSRRRIPPSSASPESTTANYVSKSPNNSLFSTNNTPSPNLNARSSSQDNVTFNSAGIMTFSNPSTAQPTPITPALSVSSPGAGPSSISQNAFNQGSLFTSYRDPSASYSLGHPFGDFNAFGTPSNGGIAEDFGMDFGIDMSSISNHDLGAFGLGNDFDDLFGGQLGALDGTNSYGGVGSIGSPSSAGVMTSAPTPQTTSTSAAPTPASTQPPLISMAPSASDWRRCPKTKQDFVELVRRDSSNQPSTFGPPLTSDDKAQIEQDWQQFTQRPELKELDVDHLCYELFDKAQCTELKTRMKQSMMRIAKDMASGQNPA
ncbi:Transcription factor PAP1 [Rhizoctonia solani]|uniref:Transcription factor PAP1 n=1 Tax=Rhizoctonia solani TaxID=456999 RepID=A0A8H7IKH2_9AGAM|nr:Transcription factor PAP1 [Rhizoctonia solani]